MIRETDYNLLRAWGALRVKHLESYKGPGRGILHINQHGKAFKITYCDTILGENETEKCNTFWAPKGGGVIKFLGFLRVNGFKKCSAPGTETGAWHQPPYHKKVFCNFGGGNAVTERKEQWS